MKRLFLAVLLCVSMPAMAGRLQVSPTSFVFSGQTSKELWVSNTSDTPLSAQVRVMEWSQDNFEDNLQPAKTVLASPAMVEVAPHTQQLVRVIVPQPLGAGEKTFRVIVDELPSDNPQNNGAQVNFLLRYSIPLFYNADVSAPQLTFAVQQMDGKWFVVATNPTDHTVKAFGLQQKIGAQTKPIVPGLVGYVLPHSHMRWPLPGPVSGQLLVTLNEQTQPTVVTP